MKENAYLNLWQGDHVAESAITADNPNLGLTVETLVDLGKVIGQRTFNEQGVMDVEYWIPQLTLQEQLSHRQVVSHYARESATPFPKDWE